MEPLRLSNSEAVSFRRCKRKWWLSSKRGLQKRVRNPWGSALHVGTVVHDALAAYYDPEVQVDPVEWALDFYNTATIEDPGLTWEIEQEMSLVLPMLESYIDWLEETGEDQNLNVTGAERMVEVPLTKDGRITVISKLDAPVDQISDGAKLALEHKTTGDLDEPINLDKLNTQFLTEHLVRFLDSRAKGATVEDAYDECQGILVNMLKKNKRTSRAKPPFFRRVQVTHNIHELRNHWTHVLSVAREIEEAHERLNAGESHHSVVPPNPTGSCKWDCPFFSICPMFDDGSNVEAAIEASYEVHDPLERYEGAEEL